MRRRLLMSVVLAFSASAAFAAPVYVPLGSAGFVVVIDSAGDRVTGRIDGLPAVHGLAATPDGRRLIAGSADERPVGEKGPDKPAAISEEDHGAHHPAPGADSQPMSPTLSTVSIVDAETGTVSRRIDVPGGVHHVVVDPAGRFAVVTHPALGGITAIDLSSFEIAATVLTGPVTNFAAFSPDGGRLYVSNAGNGTVSEIDVERWIVRRNAVVGESPEHLVVSADGSRLFVNNVEAGTVSAIDTDAFEVVDTLKVGATLHGIALSEDGATLFVAVMDENRLVAFDLGGAAPREVKLAPAPYHIATIAGTGKLYVSSADEPKLWVVDQATLAVRGDVEIGGKGHQMVPTAGW